MRRAAGPAACMTTALMCLSTSRWWCPQHRWHSGPALRRASALALPSAPAQWRACMLLILRPAPRMRQLGHKRTSLAVSIRRGGGSHELTPSPPWFVRRPEGRCSWGHVLKISRLHVICFDLRVCGGRAAMADLNHAGVAVCVGPCSSTKPPSACTPTRGPA